MFFQFNYYFFFLALQLWRARFLKESPRAHDLRKIGPLDRSMNDRVRGGENFVCSGVEIKRRKKGSKKRVKPDFGF